MIRNRLRAAGALSVLAALTMAPLAVGQRAAALPTPECSIKPATFTNGPGYLISGSGFEPGKPLNFMRNGNSIGGGIVPADGTYSVPLRVDQGSPDPGIGFFAQEGFDVGARKTTCTIINAAPACDQVKIEAQGFRNGQVEGLKDGREDGYADAYKKSYDDAFKTKQGLTADECKALEAKGYTEGYKKSYETGFAEGQKQGGKEGKKEGKEDRRKGNTSRNVVIGTLAVTATPASGEVDCTKGVTFTATLAGTGTGTVRGHWERSSGAKVSTTVEFGGTGSDSKTVTDQAAIPAGATTATVSEKFVIDNGPSKGKTATADASVTCKK